MALADLLGLREPRPRLRGLADLIGADGWRPPLLPPEATDWRPPLLPPGIAGPVEFDRPSAQGPEVVEPPQQTSRGRLAELLEQLGAAPPPPVGGFRDLDQDQRRSANMQALGMLAQAIGGAQPGRLGSALGAAAAALPAQRQAMVEQERERMVAAEEDRRRRIADQVRLVEAQRAMEVEAEAEAKQAAIKERADRLAEVIASVAPEDEQLRAQAEAAAAEGDVRSLNGILAEARKTAAIRAQGVDPYDPLATEELLRQRKLGPYVPPRPAQGRQGYAPEIEEFSDGVYLVDRNAGTRHYLGPAKGGGDASDPYLAIREEALDSVFQRMRAAESGDRKFDFQREFDRELELRRQGLRLPAEGLPAEDPAFAGVRGTEKVRPVRPRRQAATPPGVPTSDAAAPAAQPKGTADDVLSKLPTDIKVNPEAKRLIEEDLAAGKSVQEIVNELLLERAERIMAAQKAAALAGGV